MDVKHIDWHIFDGCDLREMDMSERNLKGAYFIKVDARGAFFLKAQLQEANFAGADLRNAYFVAADLRRAQFEGADLRGAVFTHADLRGASLQDSITDEHTTWDDAQLGAWEDEDEDELAERTTDGIRRIDVIELPVYEYEE